MSKHNHQSKAEQIYNKAHGVAPFHSKKTLDQALESMELENDQRKLDLEEGSKSLS